MSRSSSPPKGKHQNLASAKPTKVSVMKAPDIPADEAQRLSQLRALNIMNTTAEERFDRLTRLARRLFDVPIALVSLLEADHQWFKSAQGFAPPGSFSSVGWKIRTTVPSTSSGCFASTRPNARRMAI